MKINLQFSLVLLVFCFVSCDKVTSTSLDNKDKFIGEYQIESTHLFGIITEYDSIGNQIFQGYDTTVLTDQVISISEISGDNDTLLINSLINSFNHSGPEVKGKVINDTLTLLHDFSIPSTFNNYIKGDLWLEGDSIFLDYIWDRSNTWTSEALPVRGMVSGQGFR